MQTSVSAAGDDLQRVLQIVLDNALRLIPAADGGEIELREKQHLVCRATSGVTAKAVGSRSRNALNLPGFCSIKAQRQPAGGVPGGTMLLSAIVAPIPFEGANVGVLTLHSTVSKAFDNGDLLALQLLAGLINLGLARHAHARGERARAEADKRFKATFDQASVGIAHVTPEGQFILVNDRFCEIAGHERADLIQGGFQRITHPDDLDADLAHLQDLLNGRAKRYSMEKRYVRADSTVVWINLTVSMIRKDDGRPDFFVSVIEDISARRAAEIDAEHDQLTGLLNRRGALKRLEKLIGDENLEGFAVAFIDLDGFKGVNDRFGHTEGDRCLIKVASALRKSFRNDDMLARLGGDEFLALLPATSGLSVDTVLAYLRNNLASVSNGEEWEIGASVGVAVVPADAPVDAEAVIIAADRLMYQAKSCDNGMTFVETLAAA
ncbi:hypothetical protein MB02_14895 [Croceicoccus estronivorus]|nr:hypothetical protein MB02_14895 [Croceicoccus estronivorus]